MSSDAFKAAKKNIENWLTGQPSFITKVKDELSSHEETVRGILLSGNTWRLRHARLQGGHVSVVLNAGGLKLVIAYVPVCAGPEALRFADLATLMFKQYSLRPSRRTNFNYAESQAVSDYENETEAVRLLKSLELALLEDGVILTGNATRRKTAPTQRAVNQELLRFVQEQQRVNVELSRELAAAKALLEKISAMPKPVVLPLSVVNENV